MSLEALIPLLSTLLAAFFAALIFARFLERRSLHHLIWALSLVFYGVAVGAEFLGRAQGWTPWLYRLFYFFGGVLVAGYLGMGTMLLLGPPRLARTLLLWLALGSAYAALRVFTSPIDIARLPPGVDPAALRLMPQDVRVVAAVLNACGTLALVGGALVSARVYWLGRGPGRRVASNLLIAAGALVAASGSTLLVLGLPAPFSLAKLTGLGLILAGFRLAVGERRASTLASLSRSERAADHPPSAGTQRS